jgi:hypothetical protein
VLIDAGYAAVVDLAAAKFAPAVELVEQLGHAEIDAEDDATSDDDDVEEEPVIVTNITDLAAWVEKANQVVGR